MKMIPKVVCSDSRLWATFNPFGPFDPFLAK